MRDFVILTDSASDLPYEMVEKYNVKILGISCIFNGNELIDSLDGTININKFYESLKNGSIPETSLINPSRYINEFEPILKEGKDIIYICLSSGLSGMYNSALLAKETLLDTYNDAHIEVIDSLSASMGEGLLVYHACKLKEDGNSFKYITDWLNNHVQCSHIWFMVEDLNHLKKGGRISTAQAIAGNLLKIKPIITADREGKLVVCEKIRTRKKSIKTLIDIFNQKCHNIKNQIICIGHANCEDEAINLEKQIKSLTSMTTLITQIRIVIGSHTGPSALGIAFIGEQKRI